MPKRSSKPEDANQAAHRTLRSVIAKADPDAAADVTPPPATPKEKDPAAVALGRRGGLKGGKARAAAMTPERRAEIARKAAAKRWATKK
jgi:hypothetical protein